MRARATTRQRIVRYLARLRTENATSTGTQAEGEVPQPEAEDAGRIESLVGEAGAGDARESQPQDHPEEAGGFKVVEQLGRVKQFYDDGSGSNHVEPPEAPHEETKKSVAPKKRGRPKKAK